MPRVSALIPTYDRQEFITGAIETVLGQTYDDIEAVVVDDGSTDGTRAMLQEYEANDRVQVLHNERNRGISASFNRAADAARGEYFCILGDDDRWHPEKIERQLAVMERLDEEYAVVYTWGTLRQNGVLMDTYTNDLHGDVYPEILGKFKLTPHSSHMIRASCFDAVGGFDPDFDRAVDWEMNIRLAKEYKFEYVPEFLTVHHHHGGNIPKADYVAAYRQIVEKYSEDRRRYPAVKRAFRARWHQINGWAQLVQGDKTAGVRHYGSAFRQTPTVFYGLLLILSLFGPRAFDLAKAVRGAYIRARHDDRATIPAQ